MKKNQTIAICFAQEDNDGFNRVAFPILNRPVVEYALMAMNKSQMIDQCYISTSSEHILNVANKFSGIRHIKRHSNCENIVDEFIEAFAKVEGDLGYLPENVVILLGNSPCILAGSLDKAI